MNPDVRIDVAYVNTFGSVRWKMYKEANYLILHPDIHHSMMLLDAAISDEGDAGLKDIGYLVLIADRKLYTVYLNIVVMET